MNALPLGTLLISVDCERGCGSQDRQDHALASRVAATLSRADLKATVGVKEPGSSRLADGLLAEFPQAELALLADESWAGPTAQRQLFAAGLGGRMFRAASAGYAIRTLIFPGAVQETFSDLLVKHGIDVVRGNPSDLQPRRKRSILSRFSGAASSRLVAPRSVRFGLWDVPCSVSLPGTPGSVLRAWIDRASESRGIVHLRIDVPALLRDTRGGLLELGRLVEHAASRRDARRLRVATLSELADSIRRRRATPSQSILKTRAA